MKKLIFKILSKLNKLLLPSYSRQGLDLAKASKLQLTVIGWRYYVTTNSLD
ncbi:SsrA-binding protein [Flavobacteriaceae bacterium R38]|nr:SsrA-binding protein [Flavobacteriaceae bacterium R38]